MVVMITCNSIHISQEIFAINVLRALKSFLEQPRKHILRLSPLYGATVDMETRLNLTNVKNSFSRSHNKQVTVCGLLQRVLYQYQRVLYQSHKIWIEHCTRLWPRPLVSSGSSWPSNYQTTVWKEENHAAISKSWKKHWLIPYSHQKVSCPKMMQATLDFQIMILLKND